MQNATIRRKRIFAALMTGILALGSLTACGKDNSSAVTGEETIATESVAQEAVTETVEPMVTGDDGTIREDLTAIEVSKLMGNGINLGNTMEAYGHIDLGTTAEVSAYETYWGQPVTTQEMINGMKECGFDSIRIPIAWTNAMDFESGDYTIGEAYLDRIDEIITYARNASMYVIINDH